jgi:hypothetical protein
LKRRERREEIITGVKITNSLEANSKGLVRPAAGYVEGMEWQKYRNDLFPGRWQTDSHHTCSSRESHKGIFGAYSHLQS